ncbi:MAG: DUF2975 domain-containing protein [Steroidobacteraceae bacterium]|nr:DUF2975 domain-containing protein [Steroidobacteraceae bacterium]
MNVATNQVEKVMRGSAYARGITTFLILAILPMFAVVTLSLFAGWPKPPFKFSVGAYVFSHESLGSLPVKLWVLGCISLGCVLGVGILYLLRSVFANLARGEIFCAANVRIIRKLGWLLIFGGLFNWLAPLASAAFFMFVGHDGIEFRDVPMKFTAWFSPFAYGGMLILLSWIMAVGLGVREDAEELRRDAELVI